MVKYVAFLRGINVGGHKKIKMDDLRAAFASWGFTNIKTLLASGNVLFDSKKANSHALKQILEKNIAATFGFEVPVILRTLEEIQDLADADPFKGIKVTPQTRLYATFLSEKPTSKLKIPYTSPEKDFTIVQVTNGEVLSVLTLTPNRGTIEAMAILEKEFGKNITTRNWNTVIKVLKS